MARGSPRSAPASWSACACGSPWAWLPLAGALQQPDEVRDRQRLAAARRVDARGQKPAGRLVAPNPPTRRTRCATSCGAARERHVDQLEQPGCGNQGRSATARASWRSIRTRPEYTRGIEPEHRRRHHAVAPDVAEEPDLDAGHAVVLAARVRRRAARRPRPAPSPSPCGSTGTRRADAAGPGRRRCTAGWPPAPSAARPGLAGCSVRMSRLSTGQPVDLAVGMLGDGLRKLPGQHRIDLDGGHPGAPIEQGQRQRTKAGTDLEDVVVPIDAGGRDDTANGVRVVNEVLAERLARPEVNLFRQMSYLGPPEESNSQALQSSRYTRATHPNLCRARVTSAIAICSSLVARSALAAYLRPPLRSQVF